MRYNYLEWIQKHRDEECNVYYRDETWVFKKHRNIESMEKCHQKTTDDLIKVPSGRGERSMLSHVASAQTGLFDESMLLYRGSKSNTSTDYHSEVNRNVYSDSCIRVVIPVIAARRQNAVLVLNRSAYHTYIDEEDKRPNRSWNKNRVSQLTDRLGGSSEDRPLTWRYKKIKAQLQKQSRKIHPSPTYKIQRMVSKFETSTFKLKFLFLPIAHTALNPIGNGMENHQEKSH